MAQLVEQLTVNQWVTGSSPVIPANLMKMKIKMNVGIWLSW